MLYYSKSKKKSHTCLSSMERVKVLGAAHKRGQRGLQEGQATGWPREAACSGAPTVVRLSTCSKAVSRSARELETES